MHARPYTQTAHVGMSLCMYECVCIYIYVTYIHIYIYIHNYYMGVCMYGHVCEHVYVYTHTFELALLGCGPHLLVECCLHATYCCRPKSAIAALRTFDAMQPERA